MCFIEGHYTTSSIRQQAPVRERGQRQGHATTFPIAYGTYREGEKQLAELIRALRTPQPNAPFVSSEKGAGHVGLQQTAVPGTPQGLGPGRSFCGCVASAAAVLATEQEKLWPEVKCFVIRTGKAAAGTSTTH